MSEKDGGDAFPRMHGSEHGLSIRDWFAGQALAATADNEDETVDAMAEWAYRIADAMLRERAK